MRRVALVALALAACSRAVPSSDPGSAPSAAVKAPTGPVLLPPKPVPAEVEISGRVTVPRAAKGDVMVYVTDRVCWQADARVFGQTRVVDTAQRRFFVEVFVPQGTSMYVCSAVVDGAKPVVFHGELARGPLSGRGVGEVVFADLQIAIAKGTAVSLPSVGTR